MHMYNEGDRRASFAAVRARHPSALPACRAFYGGQAKIYLSRRHGALRVDLVDVRWTELTDGESPETTATYNDTHVTDIVEVGGAADTGADTCHEVKAKAVTTATHLPAWLVGKDG